jgi:hypothetical protein
MKAVKLLLRQKGIYVLAGPPSHHGSSNKLVFYILRIMYLYVVSESGPKRAFEVTDTLEATTLLPRDSIIVLSFC